MEGYIVPYMFRCSKDSYPEVWKSVYCKNENKYQQFDYQNSSGILTYIDLDIYSVSLSFFDVIYIIMIYPYCQKADTFC